MKIEIKCRFTGSVLFAHDAENNSLRLTLEAAVSARAYLEGANLARANLEGANLAGAYLEDGEKLVGRRPIFQLGPIGSRCAHLVAYLTDQGLRIRAGCFFGTVAEFKSRLTESHGDDTAHYYEYKAALEMINIHEDLWAPKPTTDEDD